MANTKNPSQGLIPLVQTDIFTRRMQGWAQIVGGLVRYLELTVFQEQKLSCEISGLFSEMSSVLDLEIFGPEETVQMSLDKLIKGHGSMALERGTFATCVEDQILPILRELLYTIRKKARDEDREWVSLDQALNRDMDEYITLSTQVRKSLVGQQWRDGGEKEMSRDPWLANLALQKHIAHCFKKQPDYRAKLLQQQDSFSNFEKVIVQNIKVSLSTFYEFRSNQFSMQFDLSKDISAHLDRFEADLDWAKFKSANELKFLNPSKPLVQIADLTYDGFDDIAIRSIRQGSLLKKEGVIVRSYKPCHCVLTQSGYFHILPPLNPGDLFPDIPELSLDLNECSLQPLMMNEKEPEELAFIEKSKGMFGSSELRGKTMADSADWWGTLNEAMRKQSKRPPRVIESKDFRFNDTDPKEVEQHVNLAPPIPDRHHKESSPAMDSRRPAPMPPKKGKNGSNDDLPQKPSRNQPAVPKAKHLEPQSLPPSTSSDPHSTNVDSRDVEEHQPSPTPSDPFHSYNDTQPEAFQKMALADQMEMALKSVIKPSAAAPSAPVVETFTSFDSTQAKGSSPSANAWDTFKDEAGGW